MNPIDRLIQAFAKLPGIGHKSATRLAFHILRSPEEYAREFAEALVQVKSTMRFCSQCLTFAADDPCHICRDARRDHGLICVVEKPADMNAIEQTGAYRGIYHILHGLLSPLEGIGPEDIKATELLGRIKQGPVGEIIVATNPTVEGEATATYLASLIKPTGVHLTRIASGIPLGGEVEYTNPQTLTLAIQSRRVL